MASNQRPAIFLTGQPGSGKTTVIRKLIDLIHSYSEGFYTREIRENNSRIGFEIVTLDGKRECLATKNKSINFAKEQALGDYKVNIDAVDLIAVPAILKAISTGKAAIIDEIGPMEIFSNNFCDTISTILDDDKTLVLGTIVKRPNSFADRVKSHPRVTIIQVTLQNRNELPLKIYSMLEKHLVSN